MKTNPSLTALVLLPILFAIGEGNAQRILDLPSQSIPKAVSPLLREQGDMRHLVSQYSTLTNRIARGVCLIEDVQRAKRGASTNAWEVDVRAGTSLQVVLEKAGVHNRGGQIRIFKENEIKQSSITVTRTSPDAEKFRATIVVPGDVVVFALPD